MSGEREVGRRLMGGSVDDTELDERAEQVAAHLLIFTYIRKSAYKDLVLNDELRDRVRQRLDKVGLDFVDHFYSEYFSVRLKSHIESDVTFDWSTNMRLHKGAVALVVILWAKLVLPKRVAEESRQDIADNNLEMFPEHKPRKAVILSVHRDALYAEFGQKFGKVNFQRYLGQLRNLGYIAEDRNGTISEGPLLDLMIDGNELAMKLKDSVLWDILGAEAESQAAQAVLPAVGGAAARRVSADEIGYPEGMDRRMVLEELGETLEDTADFDEHDAEPEGRSWQKRTAAPKLEPAADPMVEEEDELDDALWPGPQDEPESTDDGDLE